MTSALPINIGVTGHRDIPQEDKPKLKKAIEKEISAMQTRYPNTAFNLLCGLAEGADQLVAEVALHLKLNVIAVLPCAQSEYEKDFTSPQAIAEFRQLLKKCSDVRVCEVDENAPPHEAYRELGRTLVSCSDIVFALWDGHIERDESSGEHTSPPGGTADVVDMCIQGTVNDTSMLFSKPNQTFCKWLLTNREQHDEDSSKLVTQKNVGTWQALPITGNQTEATLLDIFKKIEQFNLDAAKVSQADKDTSIAYLLGSVKAKERFGSIQKLIDIYSLADCLAQNRQKQRSFALIFITILSFFAIATQQVYTGLHATFEWYFAHVLLVSIVILVYRLFFAGAESREEQFVERRVFAENLRVQIFWHIAGIADNCANNYRTTKFNEMDWIVDNLNKVCFNMKAPSGADLDFVKTHWIANQRDYFYGREDKAGRASQLLSKSKQYRNCSLVFFVLALGLMVLSSVKIEFNLLTALSDNMMFLIVALLFIASALFKTFSVQMGFEELSHRYLRTGYFFQQALDRIKDLESQKQMTPQQYTQKMQHIVKIIGLEALNENASWLQLHKMNAYQVQIN